MILAAEKIAKILILLCTIAGGCLLLKPHWNRRIIALFIILVFVIAVTANKISEAVPPLTDEVTLTALGEKRAAAEAEEVYFSGYTVDGKTFAAGKYLQIKDGHWFWSGETYCWRFETDSRQPEGITRSITVEIPVGWERTLNFTGNIWRGIVEVDTGENVWRVDTYAEAATVINEHLGRSETSVLILQSVLRIGVFAIGLVIPSAAIYLVLLKSNKYSEGELTVWIASRYAALICGAIAIISVYILFQYSENTSFWYDEIWQIGFCLEDECTIEKLLFTHSNYYPGFYMEILSWVYRIAPYGERWLLLLPEVFTVWGIYLVAMAAKRVYGSISSIFVMLLGTTNTTLIVRSAYEFRGYWLLFFSCCLTLYIYVRYRNSLNIKATWKRLFTYGVALWFPATSHVFGVFFSAGLAITDMAYMLAKRLSPKWIVSFCFTGVLYFPWFYNMICCNVWSMQELWNGTPSLESIVTLLQNWSSHGIFGHCLLLIGIGLILAKIGLLIYKRERFDAIEGAPLITLIFIISFVYFYGKYINPTSTMWVERYFVVLVPCILWLQALAAISLCKLFKKQKATIAAICLACACIGITNTLQWFPTTENGGEQCRQAADWFYTQANTIYNDSTIIVSALGNYPDIGWRDYYLTRKGRRDMPNIINQQDVDPAVFEDKSVVYLYYEHSKIAERMLKLLEENGFVETASDKNLKICTYTRTEQEQ